MIKPPPAPGARYAIYFRPAEDDPLVCLADRWLGRGAADESTTRAPVDGLAPDVWRRWIAAPALYGFHATLKPPFRLAPGRTLSDLAAAIDALAASQHPFVAAPLELRAIGSFLALGFSAAVSDVTALAARCVREFDAFRAPASETEVSRRRAGGLTARQDALLRAWGYPYVLDEFRFHMTLTGALDDAERDRAAHCLDTFLEGVIGEPLPVADLCLFEQPVAGAPFHLLSRHPLCGSG